MHDAVWCYAMIVTELQIQAILLENLQSVGNIIEKAMAGDNKDDSFSCKMEGEKHFFFPFVYQEERKT